MEYALYALVMLGLTIGARIAYLLAGIWQGVKSESMKEENNVPKVKELQRYVIESMILMGFIFGIMAVLFLFAHEGVM